MNLAKIKKLLEKTKSPQFWLFLSIVLLSCLLRFWNLDTTPLWYSDEGVNLNIAWNLVNGQAQMFACDYVFMPHPPLFYLLSGFFLKIFGYNLVSARMLTALCGVATTVLLFFIGKDLANKYVGLAAGFLFAIFPLAVLYNRWDFDYNLLQLFATFTLLACVRFYKTRSRKWFFAAALGAGAASVTSFIGLGLVVGLIVLFFVTRSFKTSVKAILLALGVFAVYILCMLALQWDFFLFSLNYMLSKQGSGSGTIIFDRLKDLILFSPWFSIGFLGLLTYPVFSRKKQESTITLGLFSFLFLFTLVLFSIQGNHIRGIIQLFPFFALGIAFAIGAVLRFFNPSQMQISKSFHKIKTSKIVSASFWLCVALLLAVPIGAVLHDDFNAVNSGFNSGLEPLCTQSADNAYQVAEYVNSQTSSNDFVLVSPQIAWLMKSNATTLTQAVAINNLATAYFPGDMESESFVYNCSYTNAKFLVSDHFSEIWTFKQSNVAEIASNILSNWTRVYEVGEYQVYLNPSFE